MSLPIIIKGENFTDQRGTVFFNNDFDFNNFKRVYFIENINCNFVRAWQGHKIEKRVFFAIIGSFEIKVIKVDNWEQPSKNAKIDSFVLHSAQLDVLLIPEGYITSIQSLVDNSKLMVMSDYNMGEIEDDYRFPADYFEY